MTSVTQTAGLQQRLSSPELRKLIERMVRRRVPETDVDDVVQTVLCDALASDAIPSEDEELRKWIAGITRHKVADFHRKGRRAHHVELPEHIEGDEPPHSANEWVNWAEERTKADPEARRTLDWMARESTGEKLAHIAEEARVPATQVRQRVSRLRRWMRQQWAAELAAVAAIVLLALVAWRLLRKPEPIAEPQDPPPESLEPIAPERPAVDPQIERGRQIRAEALLLCQKKDWAPCLDGLDAAAKLDAAGDTAPEVRRFRSEAHEALRRELLSPDEDDNDDKDDKDASPDSTEAPAPVTVPSTKLKSDPDKRDKSKPDALLDEKRKKDKESAPLPKPSTPPPPPPSTSLSGGEK